MKATIIIATYNHAQYLPAAIACALAQTVPVEVIVVDDGSTDDTAAVLARFSDRIRAITLPHGGVAAARNAGIDVASTDFLMFLDADDEIAPTKVERQLDVLDGTGLDWTFCDTRIVEVNGREELASDRYGYEAIFSIAAELQKRNFIPTHAPLIRRAALGALRFPAGELEDWALWRDLAAVAPVGCTLDVLATYRKRPRGRNATQRERRAA